MRKEIYKRIDLESELSSLINEGKTREEAISILIEKHGNCLNYILEAYLMPFDEIEKEIERYDNSKSKLDEVLFVKELCERYNVDRKAIIERIQNVRSMNRIKALETHENIERLKYKREMLQSRREDINRPMSPNEKVVHVLGTLVTSIASLMFFYPESPVLVALITMAYAAGVPSIKTDLMIKKDKYIVNELVELDGEIEFLEEKLDEKRLIKK